MFCSRNSNSVLIFSSKLTSDHISKISSGKESWTDINFEVLSLFKLLVKTSLLSYFLSSSQIFPFSTVRISRVFLNPSSLEQFGKRSNVNHS